MIRLPVNPDKEAEPAPVKLTMFAIVSQFDAALTVSALPPPREPIETPVPFPMFELLSVVPPLLVTLMTVPPVLELMDSAVALLT